MHALLVGFLSSILTVGLLADVGKDDVKRLLQAGIAEQTIVEFIRKNAPAEPLTVDDITELRSAGAGDAVINAMLEVSRTSDALTRSSYGAPDNSYSGGTTVVENYTYPAPAYYPSYSYSSYYPYYSTYYPYYPYYPYYYYRPYRYYPYYNYYYPRTHYYPKYPYYNSRYYPNNYYRPNYYHRPYSSSTYRPYSGGYRYSTPSYSTQPYRSTQQYRGSTAPRMSAPAPRTTAPRMSAPAQAPRGGAGSYRR
jgi:hypothetical protein